jgi:eukaryotic-like serine/threonine-protein kinase
MGLLTIGMTMPVQLGPYLLMERIGHGGMAMAFKAMRHGPNGFKKLVVVKAMLPELSSQAQFVAMFSAEARLMARLEHPNIVQVHDYGIVGDVPYFAMEYLPGRNLAQLSRAVAERGQRVPIEAALAIAREVSQGLAYVHHFVEVDGSQRQVIHRDVSPANVMVCREGSVKLLDFGVAKIIDPLAYDETRAFKGKYRYMAPEQVTRNKADRRVDVYALGVVLHELLSGQPLFAAATELETLRSVAAGRVRPPSAYRPDVPEMLDRLVMKALERDPAHRYDSGAELAQALETLGWSRSLLARWVDEVERSRPVVNVSTELTPPPTDRTDPDPPSRPWPTASLATVGVPEASAPRRPERRAVRARPSSSVPPPLPPAERAAAAGHGPPPSPRVLVAATGLLLTLGIVGVVTVSLSPFQRNAADVMLPVAIGMAPSPPEVSVPTLAPTTPPAPDPASGPAADASEATPERSPATTTSADDPPIEFEDEPVTVHVQSPPHKAHHHSGRPHRSPSPPAFGPDVEQAP